MNPRQLLQAILAEKNVSQNALSKAAKVSQSSISRFIAGATITYDNASRLAAALEISTSSLFDEAEASRTARELKLPVKREAHVAENIAIYRTSSSQWPFSAELLHAIRQCGQEEIERLEVIMRAHLGLPISQGAEAARPAESRKRAGT